MKAYLYSIFYLFLYAQCVWLSGLGISKQNLQFTDISYSEGELSDTFTCYFSQRPICIYEPQPDRDMRVAAQTITFFVPLASFDTQCRAKVARLNSDTSGISITVEAVSKPLRGINITFKYDGQKKSWDHALLDTSTDTHGIVVRFHDKQALARINQRSSPLRWYAQGKHQPRIVLDASCGGHDAGYCYNAQLYEKNSTFSYVQALGKILSMSGFEVFCTRNADVFVSPDARSTYANLVCHADLLVSFAASCVHQNCAASVTIQQYPTQTRHSTATLLEEQGLKHFFSRLHGASTRAAELIHSNLRALGQKDAFTVLPTIQKDAVALFQSLELPAVQVQLGALGSSKRNQIEVVKSLSVAIACFFKQNK